MDDSWMNWPESSQGLDALSSAFSAGRNEPQHHAPRLGNHLGNFFVQDF
jgi:hypothetical protein